MPRFLLRHARERGDLLFFIKLTVTLDARSALIGSLRQFPNLWQVDVMDARQLTSAIKQQKAGTKQTTKKLVYSATPNQQARYLRLLYQGVKYTSYESTY